MNLFNRIVVVFLLLFLLALSAALIVAPQLVASFLADLFAEVSRSVSSGRVLSAVGSGALLLVICLALLWLEFRAPRYRTIKMQQVTGGEVHITPDSVARRIKYHIDQLPGVIEVKPEIAGRKDGIRVILNLTTGPEIDIPRTTEEVCRTVRDLVETKMGLKLASDPLVRVRFGPFLPSGQSEAGKIQVGEFPASEVSGEEAEKEDRTSLPPSEP